MTTTVQVFPWVTNHQQISTIMSYTDLMFSINEASRQRYISWRLWSLQKSITKAQSSYDAVKPKFYLEDNEDEVVYSEDESDFDNQDYIPNSFEHTSDDEMSLLSHMAHYHQQEEEEVQLHHSPSCFNNLNLYMLNN